jgi:hypothetical protein
MIATAASTLLIAISSTTSANDVYVQNNYKRATNVLSQIAYKELGIEGYLTDMEKRYVPKEIKEDLSVTLAVSRIIVEKKVVYIWRF